MVDLKILEVHFKEFARVVKECRPKYWLVEQHSDKKRKEIKDIFEEV